MDCHPVHTIVGALLAKLSCKLPGTSAPMSKLEDDEMLMKYAPHTRDQHRTCCKKVTSAASAASLHVQRRTLSLDDIDQASTMQACTALGMFRKHLTGLLPCCLSIIKPAHVTVKCLEQQASTGHEHET
jgi:hypothetical protein